MSMHDVLIVSSNVGLNDKDYIDLSTRIAQALSDDSQTRMIALEGVTVIGVAHADGSIELLGDRG